MTCYQDSSRKTAKWPWGELTAPSPIKLADAVRWPKISIVTPSFNQGEFIEETIRSVLLQNYPNLEYTVIDGGSTDNSVQIIKKYEPWITSWVSEPDRGQSHAINKGFARSTGQIVAWVNSDDALAAEALFEVANAVGQRFGCLVVGDSVLTDGPGSLEGAIDRRRPSWEEMAYDARSFPQPSVFWTRDLWEKCGPLNEDLYFAMDYALWLKMRQRCQHEIHIDKTLSIARRHPGQKGSLARATGTLDRFTRQRALAAVTAAKERGESVLAFVARSWVRRWSSGLRTKNLSLLSGSVFHREILRVAWRLAFRRSTDSPHVKTGSSG